MEIRLTRHGRHAAIVTIDSQLRLNAMTRQMLAELGRLWDEQERDECRCIVLTGAASAPLPSVPTSAVTCRRGPTSRGWSTTHC
jgi:hypothetical protein